MTLLHRDSEWLHRRLGAGPGTRVPLTGSLELTRRCNFSCPHCYLRGLPAGRELPASSWKRLLEQAAAAGCLYLSITGGEPLLHPQALDILEAAVRTGLLVVLQTNASLLDDQATERLAACPPRRIDISLYGASAATYSRVGAPAGSLERILRAVTRLQDARLAVRFKVPLVASLAGDFAPLEQLAEQLGVPLQVDGTVDAALCRAGEAAAYRLPAEEVARRECSHPARRKILLAAAAHPGRRSGSCRAGQQGFYLDSAGGLRPCHQVLEPRADAVAEGFAAAWNSLRDFSPPRFDDPPPCRDCRHAGLCLACPLALRGADSPGPGSYYCRLAAARARLLSAGDRRKRGAA